VYPEQAITMTKNHIIYTVRESELVDIEAAALKIGDLVLRGMEYVTITKLTSQMSIPVR